MEFLKALEEARLTRDASSRKILTYTDTLEKLYLSILILELIRRFSKYKKQAEQYAAATVRFPGYNKFRLHATDLYNFIYIADGDQNAMRMLKDPVSAWQLRQKTTIPVMILNGYLHQLKSGQSVTNASHMLIKLETATRIGSSEYKTLRRMLTTFDSLSAQGKKQVATKLLFAARAKLRNSDLIPILEKLVADNDLETLIPDTEPHISSPDLSTTGVDLSNYRFLVGSHHLAYTKKFLELAADGQSIPRDFVRAYLPIIEMIDDIVKGGPAFIQVLKSLQKRAKKQQ